jgi:hypothetical protein
MSNWLTLCPECKAGILRTKDIDTGKPCMGCQKKHASSLKDRIDIENEIKEFK